MKGAIVAVPVVASGLIGLGAAAEVGTLAAGVAASGGGALFGAAIISLASASVAAGDYFDSAQEKGQAQRALKQDKTFTFFAGTF